MTYRIERWNKKLKPYPLRIKSIQDTDFSEIGRVKAQLEAITDQKRIELFKHEWFRLFQGRMLTDDEAKSIMAFYESTPFIDYTWRPPFVRMKQLYDNRYSH